MAQNTDQDFVIKLVVDGKEAQATLKLTTDALDKLRRETERSAKPTVVAARAQTLLAKAAAGADLSLDDVDQTLAAVRRSLGQVKTDVARREFASLERRLEGTRRSMEKAGGPQGITGFFQRFKQAHPAMAAMGGVALVTEAVRRAVMATIAPAFSFEKAMAEVGKTTELEGAALEALGEGILELSGRLGIGRIALAGIAEEAGKLGIRGQQDILKFTGAVAKMAKVSDLTEEQAATQIAKIANAFDVPIQQVENLASSINELSNQTTSKAGGLTQAMNKIGSTGRDIKLTADQVAALSATIIDTGIESETTGTSLRNVFIRVRTESEKLAAVAGLSGDAFREMVAGDAMGALEAYLDGLRAMPDHLQAIKIKEVFGDEGFAAVSALVSRQDELNRNLSISANAFAEGTSLTREYAAAMRTVDAQWSKLKARMAAWAVEKGAKVLPMLGGVLKAVNNLGKSVEELGEEFDALGGKLDDVTAADRLLGRYNELVATGQTNTEEFRRVVDELKRRFPGYVGQYDLAGKKVKVYADELQRTLQLERQRLTLQRSENLEEQLKKLELAEARFLGAERRRPGLAARASQQKEEVRPGNVLSAFQRNRGIEIARESLAGITQDTVEAQAQVELLTRSLIGAFDVDGEVDEDALRTHLLAIGTAAEEVDGTINRMVTRYYSLVDAPPITVAGGDGEDESGPTDEEVAAWRKLQRERLEAEKRLADARRASASLQRAKEIEAIEDAAEREREHALAYASERAKQLQADFEHQKRLLELTDQDAKAKADALAALKIEHETALADQQRATAEKLREIYRDLLPDLDVPTGQEFFLDLDMDTEGLEAFAADLEMVRDLVQSDVVDSIALADALLDDLNAAFDEVATDEARAEINRLIKIIERLRDEMARAGEAAPLISEEFNQAFNDIVGLARDAGQALGAAFDAAHQRRMNQIGRERDASLDAIQRRLEAEHLSESERQRLLEERAAIEDRYREQEREAQQEQAKREKLLTLFNIALDTAAAVMAFLAKGNVPMSVAAGVIGAAQAVAVAATPVPSFRKGVDNYAGGAALVHEGELLTGLAPGTNVITNANIQRMFRMAQRGAQAAPPVVHVAGADNSEVVRAVQGLGGDLRRLDKNLDAYSRRDVALKVPPRTQRRLDRHTARYVQMTDPKARDRY